MNAQVSSTNGIVTQFVAQLILKQVNESGLVVWYDPDQAYGQIASELELPGTRLVFYDGSFLELRRDVDELLNDSQPPRLVVYVPLERTQTHSALIELDSAGVVMQPRQQPPACNTRLSVVARKAYADDDEPWCLLDTHHRHMESRKYNFEFAAGDDHQGLGMT